MMTTTMPLRGLCALAVFSTCFITSPATAALLVETTPPLTTNIFNTEIKRDQNAGGARRGNDAFLRNGDTFVGPSSGVTWGSTGTSYDWELTYDGDIATLEVETAGAPLTLDVDPDGAWNAIKLITRATDAGRFDSAEVTVVVDEANGVLLSAPRVETASLVEFNEVTLQLDSGDNLTSLAGTLTWDFAFKPGASGSPNSQFAFIIRGLNAVPEPSTAILAFGMACFLGATTRKRS